MREYTSKLKSSKINGLSQYGSRAGIPISNRNYDDNLETGDRLREQPHEEDEEELQNVRERFNF